MTIKVFTVGSIATNCYLVSEGKDCILIDPGDEPQKLIDAIGDKKLKIILLTHGHFDHILALNKLLQQYPNVKVYINGQDLVLLYNTLQVANLPYQFINNGERIKFGTSNIEVITTPGHTPGSVCYLLNGSLFSGDTLFHRSIGRTDFADGDMVDMQNSLIKLAQLSRETIVLPGHGPSTTISDEKEYGYLKGLLVD